jgi:hypothetical protein
VRLHGQTSRAYDNVLIICTLLQHAACTSQADAAYRLCIFIGFRGVGIRIWYVCVPSGNIIRNSWRALLCNPQEVEIHVRIYEECNIFLWTSQASKWATEITARRSFPTWQNLQLNSSWREKVNSCSARQLLTFRVRSGGNNRRARGQKSF